MVDRWNVKERLSIARGTLREYEGRLTELKGRLRVLRGRAEQARGRATLRLRRAERDLRTALDSTRERLARVRGVVESRARKALARTRVLVHSAGAGVKAVVQTYRQDTQAR